MNNSNLSEKNSLNDSTISYSYIIPNNKILIQNDINPFENPRLDEKTDFPYIQATIIQINRPKKEINVYVPSFKNNSTVKYEMTLPLPSNPLLKTVNNLVDIPIPFTNMDIYTNLSSRFEEGYIFTKVGNEILLLLNPYEKIYDLNYNYDIESFDMKIYKDFTLNLDEMFYNRKLNIIIRGELYSGKTTIFNNILNSFCKNSKDISNDSNSNFDFFDKKTINNNNSNSSESESLNNKTITIEDKIKNANKIIQVFGCALNHNSKKCKISSKFLYRNDIFYDMLDKKHYKIRANKIYGFLFNDTSNIEDFLIFHTLFNCNDEEMKSNLFIQIPENLNNNEENHILELFKIEEITNAFSSLNFSQLEIELIFKILSSIIIFNNINIEINEDNNNLIYIQNEEGINNISKMLKINFDLIKNTLLFTHKLIDGKVDKILFSREEALAFKKMLCKETYNKLFQWIILKINSYLNTIPVSDTNIHIYSIFDSPGFSGNCLNTNLNDIMNNNSNDENIFSLSTFLGNYINEKILSIFSETIYRKKMNELIKEGLADNANMMNFHNNSNILELYESETFGLFDFINKYCQNNVMDNLDLVLTTKFLDLTEKYNLNEQIKFNLNNTNNQVEFYLNQTEGVCKYSLNKIIYQNYNNVPQSVYDLFLSSEFKEISMIMMGVLFENQILKKQDNLYDDYIMSNGKPRKSGYIINKFLSIVNPIFDFGLSSNNNSLDSNSHFNIEQYKFNYSEFKNKYIICLKSNNKFEKKIIFPRLIYNQIVYNDILEIINFYNEEFDEEIPYEKFNNEIFSGVVNENVIQNTNNLDNKEKAKIIIDKLIDFKLSSEVARVNNIRPKIPNKPKEKKSSMVNENKSKEEIKYLMGNTKIFMQKAFYEKLLEKLKELNMSKKFFAQKIAMKMIGFKARKKYLQFKRLINYLQIFYRKYKKKLEEVLYLQNVIFLQSSIRKYQVKKKILVLKKKIIQIQKVFKGMLERKKIKKIKNSIRKIIPHIRYFLTKQILKNRKEIKNYVYSIIKKSFDKIIYKKKYEFSIKLNSFCRMWLYRINNKTMIKLINQKKYLRILTKSALKIQTFYRAYSSFMKYHCKKFSTDLIRGYWKMIKAVNKIDSMRNSIIKIQKAVKKYLNQKASFENLTNQYLELHYSKYYNDEIKRIKQYFNSKNSSFKNISENENIYVKKILFFSKIIDIDLYNSTIHYLNDEYFIDKYSKIELISKKIYSSNIINIQLGECHTLLLNSKGKVFSFGWNENKQCDVENGINKSNNTFYNEICTTRNDSYLLDNKNNLSSSHLSYSNNNFNYISSSRTSHLYATDTKKKNMIYYIYEDSINTFNFGNKVEIKQISCGKSFVMFLTNSGLIYSRGTKNSKGELGLGDFKGRSTPTLISIFIKNGDKIISVKCGYKHTIALSSNGKIYSWGSNSNGQCGISIKSSFNKPMWINVNFKIINICCGLRNSFFLSEDRKIYFCGNGGVNNFNSNNLIQINFPFSFKNSNLNSLGIFPVKINCTWNESLSVFYVTFASVKDIIISHNNVNGVSMQKIKWMLDKLTFIWDTDNINVKQLCKNVKGLYEYI